MDLYAKLSSNLEELASSLDTRMQEHENKLKKLSNTDTAHVPHKDLATLSCEFAEFKSLVWKTLGTMKKQLELLVQGLDRQESMSRRKVLLFHGIPESSDSSVEDTVATLLHSQFKMTTASPELFSACHRLGTNTSKPRPIMVRFASYRVRSEVWNAKTTLKNTGITVSEFLTKTRHEVFTAARKHFGIRRCWTSEGRVVILLSDNKRLRIEAMSELKPLLADHPAAAVSQPKLDKPTPGTSKAKAKTPTLPAAPATKPGTRRTAK